MSVRRAVGRLACLLLALGLSGTSDAHDFWIEPSTYRPGLGARIDLVLRVGEGFAGEVVPRDERRLVRFDAWNAAAGLQPVLGLDGRSPAGHLRMEQAGVWVLGYRSHPNALTLEAAAFERYLVEEGLEHVVAERKARGESSKPGREIYARCAKALVVARGEQPLDAAQSGGFDRLLGFPLEIVPEENPALRRPGDPLNVRVLWQDRPLAGALLGLQSRPPVAARQVRTDREGRAVFALSQAGPHLLHVVHMVRAPQGSDHDWESQWASLTFDVAGP